MKFSFDKFNKYLFVVHEKKLIIVATIIVTILVFFEIGSLRANRISDQDILTSGMSTSVQKTTKETLQAPSTSQLDVFYRNFTDPPEEATQADPSSIVQNQEQATAVQQEAQEPVTMVQYATAVVPNTPADYGAQWNAGYLLAIDNPDTTYKCPKVTLSKEDRELLERLCYGEFGSGGFVGAALVAQCVKDAMCFEGYESVKEVISACRYSGSTKKGTNAACKQAIRYVFGENHDAIQHKILYMYNPMAVSSQFHENQNYIMTYQDVRFFDKWGGSSIFNSSEEQEKIKKGK